MQSVVPAERATRGGASYHRAGGPTSGASATTGRRGGPGPGHRVPNDEEDHSVTIPVHGHAAGAVSQPTAPEAGAQDARDAQVTGVAGQHSLAWSTVLHLLPGVLITFFHFVVAPLVGRWGLPPLFAVYLAIPCVLIPFQLGFLLREGARRNGTLSLTGVVLYRERVPAWHFVPLVLGLLLWSGAVYSFYGVLDRAIIGALFWWVPSWFFIGGDLSAYSRDALMATWAFGVAMNAFAGPIVEELYFRGYLLPRLSRLGAWAPVVNTALFSLYHFFTPWQNVGRIAALLPMVTAVHRRRNIFIGMAVHCAGNSIVMLILLAAIRGA